MSIAAKKGKEARFTAARAAALSNGSPLSPAPTATITKLKAADVSFNKPGGAPDFEQTSFFKKHLPWIIGGGALLLVGILSLVLKSKK